MFCTKCGKQLAEGEVCACQQQAPQQEQPQQQQQTWQQPQQPQQTWQPAGGQAAPSDNRKLFSIISYISILWLVGLLVSPEKNDPRVRFNVGQGILLSIVSVALSVVSGILQAIVGAIFREEITYWGVGTGVYQTSGIGIAINWILGLAAFGATVALMVIGIMNVVKDKDTYLPIIGKYAFYK